MKTTPLLHNCSRLLSRRWFAALAAAALALTATAPAPALPGRTQHLTSPDEVPQGITAPDWASIRQQYEQHRHAVLPANGGHQARNPGQQWLTRFDGRGFITFPEPRSSRREEAHSSHPKDQSLLTSAATESMATGTWQWGLELRSYGFSGHERPVSEPPRVNAKGQRVTYDWDDTLQEWFVNDRRGLEHGFTVRERPSCSADFQSAVAPISNRQGYDIPDAHRICHDSQAGSTAIQQIGNLRYDFAATDAPLIFTLAVRGDLRPEVQTDGNGVRFVDNHGATALTYAGLKVFDADGRTLPARFEPIPGSSGRESAHSFLQQSQSRLTAAATASVERGVHAVSTPEGEGTVKRSEARAPETETALLRLVIDERGARYPLTIDPIAQQAYLKASNTGAADNFGVSVAVSGDTVVVGANGESSNATGVNGNQSDNSSAGAGAAYVFVRSGTIWSQQAYLKASNTEPPNAETFDAFGCSVAVSGDTVVVGAYSEDSNAIGVNGDQSDNSAPSSGAAYVFVRSGTTWSQQAYLKASNTEVDDKFGRSVAVAGDTVVVGATEEGSNATGVNGNQSDNSALYSGAAYVFVRNGTTWSQQAYLKASNTDTGDRFGHEVAVSGDTVVVGAQFEASNTTGVNGDQSDNSAPSSGAVYVFVRNGTSWSQQAYLKASNTGANDAFGRSVAVSGDTVVVGATGESSNASGVNGNQSDNSALNSGAVYVFARNGTTWSQQAYLKASNTGASDAFGRSVAVSGDTVVVGVSGEDSNATGVNGNQSDNSAGQSGAAYLFSLDAPPSITQQPVGASVLVGQSFSLTVAASGSSPLSYQWRQDGAALLDGGRVSGATAPNLMVANAQLSDAGNYTVAVTNNFGAVTSQVAVLSVLLAPTQTVIFANPAPALGDIFGARFGAPLAAVGVDKILIGAPGDDTGATEAGAAYLFNLSGTLLTTFTNPTPAANDQFGFSVAALGPDKVVIGAYRDDTGGTDAGAVYLFSTNGALLRTVIKPGPGVSDRFGWSVAGVGGDKFMVSAPDDDLLGTNAGIVYVYDTNDTTGPIITFLPPNAQANDYFGLSVAAFGTDKLLIGAPLKDFADVGSVYLYDLNGSLLRTFNNPNPGSLDWFGVSVAAVGTDKVLIGAFLDDVGASDTGAAYLFHTNGSLLATFTNPHPSSVIGEDDFGYSVAAVGTDMVLIGASLDDSAGPVAGAAYLFDLNGGLITTFRKPAPASDDHFAASVVAVGTSHVLIGAPGDDTGAADAGAAYLFLFPSPPAITLQPVGLIVPVGQPFALAVAARGSSPLSFQWRQNGAALLDGGRVSGATGTNLMVANAQLSDAGNYTVVVTNAFGSVTSQVATVTVVQLPEIVQQPQSRTNLLGSTATFNVAAFGTEPLSYHWRKNGVPVGNNSTNLVLPNVDVSQAGAYSVVVSNLFGGVPSQAATLTVEQVVELALKGQWPVTAPAEALAVAVQGQYAYVALGSDGLAVIDVTNPASPVRVGGTNTAGGAAGIAVSGNFAYLAAGSGGLQVINVSNATSPLLSGTSSQNGQDAVAMSGNFAFVNGNGRLESFYVGTPASPVRVDRLPFLGAIHGVAVSGNYAYAAADSGGLLVVNVSNPSNMVQVGSVSIASAQDVAVSGNYAYVTASGNPSFHVVDVSNPESPIRVGGYSSTGSAKAVAVSGNYAYVAALSDGVQLFDVSNPTNPIWASSYLAAGWAEDVAVSGSNVFVADRTGGLLILLGPTAPQIVQQPQNRTVTNGSTTSMMTVVATGSGPLRYRWHKDSLPLVDGVRVSGASSTNLIMADVQLSDAGAYTVVVTNALGTTTSQVAILTVLIPPSITSQPQNQLVPEGNTASFTVAATGAAPLSYRWHKDSLPLLDGGQVSGATSTNLVVADVQLSDAGDYTVVVTNAYGAVTSVVATLTVPLFSAAPTIASPITISQNDNLIWVVNPSDDSVSVIRPDNNTRLAKIAVGDEPQSIALTPDGQYAFVANAAAGTVTVIQINDPAWDTFSASVVTNLSTGAEPWNIVTSPDGLRVFVANSGQDTITVINATTRTIIGHVDLRNSLANDPDRSRHFQPRGLAVSQDNTKLYVTRFLSFTKPGERQGDDFGKEGLVAVLDINTASTSILDYQVARTIWLAPQITGFKFPGLTNPPAPDTLAFPNQLQSIVLRGDRAYLPNIAASPAGPLRFNLDTHAYVNQIGGVTGGSPTDLGALNLHLGATDPEPGKRRVFFANPWAIAFTTQSGAGNAYAVSAGSDLLVKLNVDASGNLSFTGDSNTTRYIDLNEPTNALTSGLNAGKNPQGIAINSTGTVAYVANFVSRNVSVVDLTSDTVIATVQTSDLPAPGSAGETNLVGAEMFFSSRGNFDSIPGTNSLRDRLSSEGWQSCASCHFKGLTDGVIWQFATGPRKSVPLNASFSPHNRTQQRLLNYSAIFDEIEDFELNIRNVSGPGDLAVPINGNSLDPNYGLLIGDNGDLNVAPSAVNAFALPSADRAQVTVTLPGSTNKVPALTAMREWVRNAVRTPNAPIAGLPNAPSPADIIAGRQLFLNAGCANCHGGLNWTVSLKDFTSPPAGSEIFTERNPTNFTGNPVGAQYLNRFLRDVGSFKLGVPGQGNPLGDNIGADEKAAPAVVNGVQLAAQDGLGIDYNSDGKGTGFNVPSLLGLYALPPYMHNGAAESLAGVVADVKHRTANGSIPDALFNPADQMKLVAFLETIDVHTVPFVPVAVSRVGASVILAFDSVNGVEYGIETRTTITGPPTVVGSVTGNGQRLQVSVPIDTATRFLRLVAP